MQRLAIGLGMTVATLAALSGCGNTSGGLRTTDEVILYPLPPDPPRVQFLTSISRSDEIEERTSGFRQFVVGGDTSVAAIRGPWGAAAHDDRIYVCDLQQRTVVVIDLAEKSFRSIRDKGRGKLRKPVQCDFDETGRLYVADRERRQVVIFGPDESYERALGPLGDEFLPLDVEVRGDEVYICDIGNRCVQVLDRESGTVRRRIGGPDELSRPISIAMDPDGNCYVVDSIRNRVVVYGPDGETLRTIGGPGDLPGTFGRARGIDIDQDGHIYVIDAASEVCQIFTNEGRIAMFFGGPGVGPGNLYLPAGVCVTTTGLEPLREMFAEEIAIDRLVIVISQFGPRIVSIYGFGTPRIPGS